MCLANPDFEDHQFDAYAEDVYVHIGNTELFKLLDHNPTVKY